MAIARISAADGTGTTSATFGATPTAGNLLLAIVYSSTTATITGWTSIFDETLTVAGTHLGLLAKNASGSEGTITPSGGTVSETGVCAYSGVGNPYVLDGTAGGSTAIQNAGLATAAITTTDAGSLIFTAAGTNQTAAGTGWTTATGILSRADGAMILGGQYLPGVTKTAYTDTYTFGGFCIEATIIAAFKPAPVVVFNPPKSPQMNQAVRRAAFY